MESRAWQTPSTEEERKLALEIFFGNQVGHLHDWRTPWAGCLTLTKVTLGAGWQSGALEFNETSSNKWVASTAMELTGLCTCRKSIRNQTFPFRASFFSYCGLQVPSCVHTPSKLITAHHLYSSGKTSPLLSPRRHPRPQPISTLSRFLKNPWRGQLSD